MEAKLAAAFVLLTLVLMILRWRPLRRLTCEHAAWDSDGAFPSEAGPIFLQHCARCGAPRSIYG